MSYVVAFAIGFLIPTFVFAAVMAAIATFGERVRPGYGDELRAWWRSRPIFVDRVFIGVHLACGALGVAAWHLSK